MENGYTVMTYGSHSLVESIGYLVCFLLLHCSKISVWSGEIIIVCVDPRGAARGDISARHLAAHQRIWN